ncbi:MAG: hypothetical protein OEW57_16075, partial [Gammaproteobacteria bacterium]|nr:hypothetical protein [Gammaproteobacteria bacterium]
MPRTRSSFLPLCALAASVLIAVGGCGREPAATASAALDVKVIEAAPRSTEIYRELVGEVRGSREVDIRS